MTFTVNVLLTCIIYCDAGPRIFVIAVGNAIDGIDEIVKVASHPPQGNLLRVANLDGLWDVVKLAVRQVYPGKYQFVNYASACN